MITLIMLWALVKRLSVLTTAGLLAYLLLGPTHPYFPGVVLALALLALTFLVQFSRDVREERAHARQEARTAARRARWEVAR